MVALVLLSYFGIGGALTYRANQHLKHPGEWHFYTRINDPDSFTEEGQHPRKVAQLFWYIGGVVALAVFLYW